MPPEPQQLLSKPPKQDTRQDAAEPLHQTLLSRVQSKVKAPTPPPLTPRPLPAPLPPPDKPAAPAGLSRRLLSSSRRRSCAQPQCWSSPPSHTAPSAQAPRRQ